MINHNFDTILSIANLYQAWEEFIEGKKYKKDVAEFTLGLFGHILQLHEDLKYKRYQHGPYQAFAINDPKPRKIHKATVRDRLLHHAIYRILYLDVDPLFIYDSYSCRNFKGTHRALERFRVFGRRVSGSRRRTCWILKCDIRKFFDNIDHAILLALLKRKIGDENTLWLLGQIIHSFSASHPGVGLPLGNLTSQLLVNIYMNHFDQYMKHQLKVKYYIRYADDFVVFSESYSYLFNLVSQVKAFLGESLKLQLHPKKVSIKTLASGVDFLGWVHFPDHRVLRTTTKRRMLKRIGVNPKEPTVQSYLGMLKHGNAYKLKRSIIRSLNKR